MSPIIPIVITGAAVVGLPLGIAASRRLAVSPWSRVLLSKFALTFAGTVLAFTVILDRFLQDIPDHGLALPAHSLSAMIVAANLASGIRTLVLLRRTTQQEDAAKVFD